MDGRHGQNPVHLQLQQYGQVQPLLGEAEPAKIWSKLMHRVRMKIS